MSNVATRAMPKTGELIAGKYRIETLIGEGGMGAVFSATHAITGRKLAVKWMLPEVAKSDDARQRLVREAQATGRIDHPNVVDVYDVGEHEGSPFLVMELLQGESLTKGLERGALKVPEIVRVLVMAVEGVAAAHRHGVIHRDIKPDNIFLCRNPQGELITAKVLDFGISKVTSMGGQLNPRLTKTGAVMGTPYYMSPEQVRGVAEIDARVDIYAFGVILYESLTGRVPFDAKTYSALVLEIATGTPARPCTVNPRLAGSLERVILKAMAREPDQRYPDMESLAKALAPFATGGTGLTGETAMPTDLGRASGPATTPFVSEGPPVVPVSRAPMYISIGGAVAIAAAIALWPSDDSPAIHEAVPTAVSAAAPPPPAQPTAAPTALAMPAPTAVPTGPDAGVAETSGTGPSRGTPTEPSIAEPVRPSVRERHRDPSPSVDPVHVAPVKPKGSGRSGTITADDF